MQLKDIIKNDELISMLNLNPYCINEGVDRDDFIEVEVENIIIKE